MQGPTKKARVDTPPVDISPRKASLRLHAAAPSTALPNAANPTPESSLRRSTRASPQKVAATPLQPVTPIPRQEAELEFSPLTVQRPSKSTAKKHPHLSLPEDIVGTDKGTPQQNGVLHGSLASDSNQHKRVSTDDAVRTEGPGGSTNSWQPQGKNTLASGSAHNQPYMGAAAAAAAAAQKSRTFSLQPGPSYTAPKPPNPSQGLGHAGGLVRPLAPCSTAVNKGKGKMVPAEGGPKQLINELWTTKHRPRKVSELVGNGNQVSRHP
jgi:hypothetical protein